MTSKYDFSAIRQLLSDSLDDAMLNELCYDYFRPVYDRMAESMSKGQRIQTLIDYCERQSKFEQLLQAVKEMNPQRYAHYEAYIQKSDVNIVTHGGSVNIGNVSGNISGSTASGDITIGGKN